MAEIVVRRRRVSLFIDALGALVFVTLVAIGAFVPSRAAAQSAAAHPSRATDKVETVQLVVRPRVGDTLWLQLEQTVETRSVPVSESPIGSPSPTTTPGSVRPPLARQPEYGPLREQSVTQVIVMRMFAHSLVESSNLETTSLKAMTDSLHVRTGVPGHLGPFRPMTVPTDERVVRVHVAPDGAMAVVDPTPGSATLDASFAGMPPMLPPGAVSAGDSWEREIPLPSLSMSGVHAEGVVRAQFHLDSVSRNAKLAYVTMVGTLRREGSARDLPPGSQVATSGTLHGSLILDRTRGWITEAETIIQVQSDMTPRAGDKLPARSMDIRLTQRMKVR